MEVIHHESQVKARAAALEEDGQNRHVAVEGGARYVFLPKHDHPVIMPVKRPARRVRTETSREAEKRAEKNR